MVEAHPAMQELGEECIEPDMCDDFISILVQNGVLDQVRTIEGLQGF